MSTVAQRVATADEVCASDLKEGSAGQRAGAGTRTRILRNLAALASAQTAERCVSLFGAIYVRRVLAVSAIGQVAWTASIISYFSLMISPGFQTAAKREVARDPEKAGEYCSLLLSLQLLLTATAGLVLLSFSLTGVRGPQICLLLLLQGLGLLITPFDVSWVLYARERMGPVSWLNLACAALQTGCLVLFVRHPQDVYRYVLLPLPFRLCVAGFAIYFASSQGLLDWRRVHFTVRGSRAFLKTSLPIGLSMATVLLYYNFDNVLLGLLRGDHAVGIYSTAYSLMLVPTFLNTAVFNAYFPLVARLRDQSSEARRVSAEVLRNMTWIGCSLAFLGWATGQQVVTLIFGKSYLESGRVFEWLCLDLVLIFFNMAYNQPLVAWNQQHLALRCTVAGAVVNVILNLVLIPLFGSMGAVVATILAEVAVLIATVRMRRDVHSIDWWQPLASIVPVCLTTGLLVRALTGFGAPVIPMLALACAALTGCFLVKERGGRNSGWKRLQRP